MSHLKSVNEIDPTIPTCVIGLAFGDEGKGMTVAYECRRKKAAGLEPLVIRFNGGAQAAHNVRVRAEDGTILHHMHQQVGSGAMYGASTVLTDGMVVSLTRLLSEMREPNLMRALGGRRPHVIVSNDAPLVLPLHALVNRALEERRGNAAHGSCGVGIGICRTCEDAARHDAECAGRLVTAGSVVDSEKTFDDIVFWARWLERRFDVSLGNVSDRASEWIGELIRERQALSNIGVRFANDCDAYIRERAGDGRTGVVFEGSQGVLLDERYGWFPHVTYGDMTPANAMRIVGCTPDDADGKLAVIGCTRTYTTRHGYGPFPSANGTMRSSVENDEARGTLLRAMSDGDVSDATILRWGRDRSASPLFEVDNGTGRYQGEFRIGLLDVPNLVRVTHDVVRVDAVSVSNVDRYPGCVISSFGDEIRIDGVRNAVPVSPHVTVIGGDSIVEHIADTVGTDTVIVGDSPCVSDWK